MISSCSQKRGVSRQGKPVVQVWRLDCEPLAVRLRQSSRLGHISFWIEAVLVTRRVRFEVSLFGSTAPFAANYSGSAICLTAEEPRLPRNSPATEWRQNVALGASPRLQYVAASQLAFSLCNPVDQTNLDTFV